MFRSLYTEIEEVVQKYKNEYCESFYTYLSFGHCSVKDFGINFAIKYSAHLNNDASNIRQNQKTDKEKYDKYGPSVDYCMRHILLYPQMLRKLRESYQYVVDNEDLLGNSENYRRLKSFLSLNEDERYLIIYTICAVIGYLPYRYTYINSYLHPIIIQSFGISEITKYEYEYAKRFNIKLQNRYRKGKLPLKLMKYIYDLCRYDNFENKKWSYTADVMKSVNLQYDGKHICGLADFDVRYYNCQRAVFTFLLCRLRILSINNNNEKHMIKKVVFINDIWKLLAKYIYATSTEECWSFGNYKHDDKKKNNAFFTN